jgi:hypothetical protein
LEVPANSEQFLYRQDRKQDGQGPDWKNDIATPTGADAAEAGGFQVAARGSPGKVESEPVKPVHLVHGAQGHPARIFQLSSVEFK